MRIYSWDQANVEHIGKHGVTPWESQYLVDHARPPFPEYRGNGRFMVRGKTRDGRWLQVVFALLKDDEVDVDSLEPHDVAAFSDGEAQVVRVVHARELTHAEKHQARKRG